MPFYNSAGCLRVTLTTSCKESDLRAYNYLVDFFSPFIPLPNLSLRAHTHIVSYKQTFSGMTVDP